MDEGPKLTPLEALVYGILQLQKKIQRGEKRLMRV